MQRSLASAVLNKTESITPSEGRGSDEIRRFKAQLHHRLIAGMDLTALGTLNKEELRIEVKRVADELCQRSNNLVSRQERDRLVGEVLDETFGLGPLQPLMNDPTVTDILINGPNAIYVERNGQLELTQASFNDQRHLFHIVQ